MPPKGYVLHRPTTRSFAANVQNASPSITKSVGSINKQLFPSTTTVPRTSPRTTRKTISPHNTRIYAPPQTTRASTSPRFIRSQTTSPSSPRATMSATSPHTIRNETRLPRATMSATSPRTTRSHTRSPHATMSVTSPRVTRSRAPIPTEEVLQSPLSSPRQQTPSLGNSSQVHASNETEREDVDMGTTDVIKKRGRGASIGKAIEKAITDNGGKTLEIEFPEGFKRPLKYGTHLTNAVGIIVRHTPELNWTTTWKQIPEEQKYLVLAGLGQWFLIKGLGHDTIVDGYIDEMFSNSYRHYKGRLSAKYKEMARSGINPRTKVPFEWVTMEKWLDLCDAFENPVF